MSDEYSFVAKSKLKLKNDVEFKKKQKKSKKSKKDCAKSKFTSKEDAKAPKSGLPNEPKLTKAEIAFKEQQEKMRNKRILERASTTHKQRVEKFNEHLDSLTEHFDIPKVSWTK